MILHDWPYPEALKILKNQLEALKVNPRSRLVIMDTVLPLPGSISIVEEALLRVRDLTMIQAFNSKERELGEFVQLFAQACDQDGSLVLKKITKPPGSVMSVMEVAYQAYEPKKTIPDTAPDDNSVELRLDGSIEVTDSGNSRLA